jgi:hypothetical protein
MMFLALIIPYLIATNCISAIPVGIIYNASLILSDINITVQASTCKECLCISLNATGNNSIVSLNCYTHNGSYVTCQMFTADMYLNSSFFKMITNSNTTFYFQQLPSINQLTITAATAISSNYFLYSARSQLHRSGLEMGPIFGGLVQTSSDYKYISFTKRISIR